MSETELELSYLEHRNRQRDMEFQALMQEAATLEPPAPETVQKATGMAPSEKTIPPPMAMPDRPELAPPGPSLTPQQVIPRIPAVTRGAIKGVADIPKQTLQSLEDVSNWIQGADIKLIESMVPGPAPSAEGSLEEASRKTAGFIGAFVLSSNLAGAALKGGGVAAQAPKLAKMLKNLFGAGASSFVTEEGGISHKIAQWAGNTEMMTQAAAQLPDEVKVPFAMLLDRLEEKPDDAAAIQRFKAALTNVVDVGVIGGLLKVAKAMAAIEGGSAGGVAFREVKPKQRINIAGEKGSPSPAPTIERRGRPVPVSPERRAAETEGIADLLSRRGR